ncbi:hypothetical protein WISP_36556 [Willisornis vidua]|uniref:Uncharacterized protein n=1 Tax=Willisornis vidua TaxID=1566151 RepID=A0ABQ9DMT9_9PASS|nr:hypothetical protein WISP_36556 [Willisornis vidua]
MPMPMPIPVPVPVPVPIPAPPVTQRELRIRQFEFHVCFWVPCDIPPFFAKANRWLLMNVQKLGKNTVNMTFFLERLEGL